MICSFFSSCSHFFAGLFGHSGRLDALFEGLEFVAVVVAQLLLDGARLLLKVVFAVAFFDLLFDAAANFAVDFLYFGFAANEGHQFVNPLLVGGRFEQILPLVNVHGEVAGDQVGEPSQIVHVLYFRPDFFADFFVDARVLGDDALQGAAHGGAFFVNRTVGHREGADLGEDGAVFFAAKFGVGAGDAFH